jgi:3-mercaptopyruvate sulfurtransferase SseA
MTPPSFLARTVWVGSVLWTAMFFFYTAAQADPSKYPQFARQKLAANVTPAFITVDELVREIASVKKPLVIDVRTEEEYRELHIVGAVSWPLTEFSAHVQNVPRDRPVVLY